MNNFIYENKTKVFFGKGGVKEYLRSLLDKYDGAVMLAYGGGSIKKNGVYDEITEILAAAEKDVVEFSGIMPNPTYAKVQQGTALAVIHPVLYRHICGGNIARFARFARNVWGIQTASDAEAAEAGINALADFITADNIQRAWHPREHRFPRDRRFYRADRRLLQKAHA